MRSLLLASVAAVAMAASAQAADLGAGRSAIAAEVVAPADLWSGFYAGVHAGYGSGHARVPANFFFADSSHKFSGAVLGGQFGWNYQVGQFVLGLEATLSYAGLAGSAGVGAGVNAGSMRTDAKWLTTMGPRLGFAFDRALIYAKGGFAAAGLTSGFVGGGGDLRSAFVRTGWFLGAGIEYAFAPNWSLRAEYNYMNFGGGYSHLLNFGTSKIVILSPLDAHVVTVGLNYRFGGGRAAAEPAGTMPIWTGFYAGVHAGYGTGHQAYNPIHALDADHTFRGALAGVQFGWNQQFGPVVAGLEAGLAHAGLTGGAVTLGGTFNTRLRGLATLGPRLGFAFDRALVYAKGGLAVAGLRGGVGFPGGNDFGAQFARSGWFAGVGAEYAFAPNWSARLEYNYVNLGYGPAIQNTIPGGLAQAVLARIDTHLVTVGVNYRFTSGPSAVVARY
jgi:outer membrane immunogenic protein